MSRIFISHATADNAKTRAIIEWIVSQGWPREEIFVDFDDISGGERWRQALEQAQARCEAVVFLISPQWISRQWCMREVGRAEALKKQIVPVLIEATPLEGYGFLLKDEYQLIDLIVAGPRRAFEIFLLDSGSMQTVELAESGLQALRIGLERAGFAPSSFPLVPGRPIYPGLAPLDIEDAAVFFGRDAEIARGLKELRLTRDRGECLLAILAASGAGKSSFLRAGLWPRLQRADTEFLVLPVLRPGTDALEGLVASLHGAGEALELKRNRADWRVQLEHGDLAGALAQLQIAARARLPAAVLAPAQSASQSHPAHAALNSEQATAPPIPVLPIDQAEELFGPQGGESARRMLELLGAALREGRLIALCAIRTDRYTDLQNAPALDGLDQRPFSLPSIAEGALKEVIEGPAQRDQKARGAKGLRIDPQLTERLMRDWADADGLPLLAFTLRRLLDDYGSDGHLTLKDYEDSGQFWGALEAAITRAMHDATAAGTLPEDAQAREALICSTFVPWLVSVDPQSQQAQRRIARRDTLPAASHDLIDRLINARLLTCGRPQDSDASVEVAHEAILRYWSLLDRIIGQEREALIVLNEVKRDAGAWLASRKGGDSAGNEDVLLHRGERLRHAEQHLARADFQHELGDEGRQYLAACRAKEAQGIEEERLHKAREITQITRTRKAQRLATVLLIAVALVTVAAGTFIVYMHQATSRASSDVLARLSEQAYNREEYDAALRFSLAAINKGDFTYFGDHPRESDSLLALAGYHSNLRAKFVRQSGVRSHAYTPDKRRIIITYFNDPPVVLDAISGEPLLITKNEWKADDLLAISPDSRYALTKISRNQNIAKLWDISSGRPLITIVDEGNIENAVFSLDGRRLFTASDGKTAKIWDTSTGEEIAKMDHGEPLRSIMISPNGKTIITVSFEKKVKIWDSISGRLHATLLHDSNIQMASFSQDGRQIVTSSDDGTACIWDIKYYKKIAIMQHSKDSSLTVVNNAQINQHSRRIVTFISTSYPIKQPRNWNDLKSSIFIWDSMTFRLIKEINYRGVLRSTEFSKNGLYIIAGSQDGKAQIISAISGDIITELNHGAAVSDARFSNDGSLALTASDDKTARVWDTLSGRLLLSMKHRGRVLNAMFSKDEKRVLTVAETFDGPLGDGVFLWDTHLVSYGKNIAYLSRSRNYEPEAGFLENERVVIFSASTGTYALHLESEKLYKFASDTFDAESVDAFALTLNRKLIALAWDGKVHIREIDSGRDVLELQHSSRIENAVFSPNGEILAILSKDNTVHLWNTLDGQSIAEISHSDNVNGVKFSHAGDRIVTYSKNGNARIFNAKSGKHLLDFKHQKSLQEAFFDAIDHNLVTVSIDNSVYVWDSKSGRLLHKMTHDERMSAIYSNLSGGYIATVSSNGIARVWNVSSGRLVASITDECDIAQFDLNRDGTKALITSSCGILSLWDTTSGALIGRMRTDSGASFFWGLEDQILSISNNRIFIQDPALIRNSMKSLKKLVCHDIFNLDTKAPPRDTDLSRLTDEELQMAAVLDPKTERDVCRSPKWWQPMLGAIGFGG